MSSSFTTLLHPATAVNHTLTCPFISPNYNSLIVATAHTLSVYNVSTDEDYLKEEGKLFQSNKGRVEDTRNLFQNKSDANGTSGGAKIFGTEKQKNARNVSNHQARLQNTLNPFNLTPTDTENTEEYTELASEIADGTEKENGAEVTQKDGIIFEFGTKDSKDKKDVIDFKNSPQKDETPHLIHVMTVSLFGTISSITSFKIAPSKRHVLAISFMEDAKISVVEYDDAKNGLKTVSLHYLEDDVLKDGKTQMHQRVEAPLRSDPSSLCAAYILFDTKLVLLPIRESSELEDFASTDEAQKPVPIRRHIIVDIAQRLGVRNILDYCFLYGYSEPTLLLLHENNQTWSARLHERANTVSCTAVSLGIERNHYPIIWTVKALPHDSYRLIPLPQAIGGGAIIVGHNSLIHANQRAQYGISTNDFLSLEFSHPDTMALALEKQMDISVMLEVISYSFISENVIAFSLKSGELYLAHIIGNVNSVQKIILKKAINTVVASTMCTINQKFLFLGSRLGNSLLSEFKEMNKRKDRDEISNGKPEKKRKIDAKLLSSSSDFLALLEMEAPEIPSAPIIEESTESSLLKEYEFTVRDTFINIGPITAMAIGKVQTYNTESDVKSKTDSRLEIATCSGYNKSGTIYLLQQSVRPSYLSNLRITLQGIAKRTINSLYYIDHKDDTVGRMVIASTDMESFILKPSNVNSEEIKSFTTIEKTRMNVSEPTLAVGSLIDDRSVSVQVCPSKVTVIKDSKIMYTKEFTIPIYAAHIVAPYVLLHLEDGTLKLLTCSKEKKLTTRSVQISMSMKGSAYEDQQNRTPEAITAASLFLNKCSNRSMFSYKENVTDYESNVYDYLAIICWSNGAIEIYTVPDFKCVFTFLQFNDGYSLIFDQNPSASERDEFARKNKAESLYVKEVLLYSIGAVDAAPYLVVRMSDNSLHIYQSFSFHAARAAISSVSPMDSLHQDNELRLSHLRFSKVDHRHKGKILSRKQRPKLHLDHLVRDRHYSIFDTRHGTGARRVIPFDSIGDGYRGIFVGGDSPVWLFSNIHNELRLHPMPIDGSITSFSPYARGTFLYTTSNFSNLKVRGDIALVGEGKKDQVPRSDLFLRVSVLPQDFLFDTNWPTKIIPLKKTPHHIVYERETSTYVVAVSKPISFEREDERLEGRFPKPQSLKFQVLLYNSKWQKLDSLEFFDFEQVLSMRVVTLMDRGEDPYNPDPSREKGFVTLLAIGTGFDGSEDDTCKGRVLLYDFVGSIEGDQHFKFERIGEVEVKGPVSAIESVGGYLSISIGTKINTYYYNWEDKEIVQASFYDSQYFTTSMKSIKDYILYGDMYDSLNLLRWHENGHQMTLLGKDVHRLFTYEVEFMYSGKELGLVVSDEERNLQIFHYAPEDAASHDGRWLLPVADFHIGSHVNTMIRLPCRKPKLDRFTVDFESGLVIFGTLEGEIGALIPLDSAQFKPLFMFQSKMFTQISHACGLHPKAYRLFQPNSFNPSHIHQKNILDGELLRQYIHLDQKLQVLISKQIGLHPIDFMKAYSIVISKCRFF